MTLKLTPLSANYSVRGYSSNATAPTCRRSSEQRASVEQGVSKGSEMRTNLLGTAAVLFFASISPAAPASFNFTFDNVLIDNNPDYPVTGSFLFDTNTTNPLLRNLERPSSSNYAVWDASNEQNLVGDKLR
jgi:hypothetical protein